MIRKIPTLRGTLGATLLLGLALPPVAAEDQESDRAADRATVRDRTQEFFKALAKGDAKKVAAFWTATGVSAPSASIPCLVCCKHAPPYRTAVASRLRAIKNAGQTGLVSFRFGPFSPLKGGSSKRKFITF
jgi:hypothetical protein